MHATKTLISKLWIDELRQYTGIGMYNVNNVQLECIHTDSEVGDRSGHHYEGEDKAEHRQPQDQAEMLSQEFSCAEDSYSKIVMDRMERFCKEQIQKRKQMLDEKYGPHPHSGSGLP